ncbi:MAG: hypothetical protein HY752_02335 [Nitrospirae bacterium]|nr:hypothetical protein [Nitrospirota bacterium]
MEEIKMVYTITNFYNLSQLFFTTQMSYDISFSISIFSKDEFDFNNAIGSPFIKAIKAEGVIIYDAQLRREKVPHIKML